jgi:Sigma-70 region 2
MSRKTCKLELSSRSSHDLDHLMIENQNVAVEGFESEALPHFDDLYRTAVRVIGDRETAEDLVQETTRNHQSEDKRLMSQR